MSSNRFALIIANDQYEDESLSKLEAPKYDAYALAEVLGDPETSNFYVQLAVNKKSHTVNQLIETFFNKRKRDDLLLLYFSGHGIKDEDGKLYFATPNTKCDRLMSTAVAASFVNELMRKTRSRSQVLLLDCCYSGAFAKGMIAKSGSAIGTTVGTYFQGRGRVVLTASDSMQYAFEEDKLVEKGSVNSIFTSAIVEGIRTWEADSNNDNRISIHELYDYIDSYVQERTPNQQPVMWSFNTQGEMIIAEREYAPGMDDEDIEVYEHVATQYPEETQLQVETEQPVEVEQPTAETVPPSQVQVSAELVTPVLEEPTESKKFPVNPVILVAIILVAIIGISYWLGIGPFTRTTDVEGGGTVVLVIEDFSVDGFTLRWSVSGATSVSIDQGIGSVALSGSTTVSPDETTTYTLTAANGDVIRYAIEQVVVDEIDVPVFDDFLTKPNIITLTYYHLSDPSTPDHYKLEIITYAQNTSVPINYVKVIYPEDINGESEHQLSIVEPITDPVIYFKHLSMPSQVTGEFTFEVEVKGETYQDTFHVTSNSYCQYPVDVSSPKHDQHFTSSEDLVFNWTTDQTNTAEQFIHLWQGTDDSKVYEGSVSGLPLDYGGPNLNPDYYDLEIEIWTRFHGDIVVHGRIFIDDGGGPVVQEDARVVVLNRGGDINEVQLVALQQDFTNVDWIVVTGEIEEEHLDSADMLIMSQDNYTWSYESWEVEYIKNWLSLGDKTIWITGDSDFADTWMRQVESNYILEEIGSCLRVESCSVEDHVSYARDYGDPPPEGAYRVLGTPYTNFEGFLTGVDTSLFHGPGAIIGKDGSSYYDLVSSTPPSTSISVLMTTSTDATEKGFIKNHDSIPPEYHTIDTYYKVALMAVEELDSNLIIVTGDSIYNHDYGLYKPELRAPTEDLRNRYEVEYPTQGDVLFSNILEYVIDKSS